MLELCVCTRIDKTRKLGLLRFFQCEGDETIFIDFPEHNFIKVDIHWMKFCKMYILITQIKCNKICAWRFIGMNNVHTIPNFTKLNIKIYIWTIVFNLHYLCPSGYMAAFIRKGLFFWEVILLMLVIIWLLISEMNWISFSVSACSYVFHLHMLLALARRTHISNQDHLPMNRPNAGSAPSPHL